MSSQAAAELKVTPNLTPNPLTVRFAVNRQLITGSGRDFPERESAAGSPLAERLFANPDLQAVYIGTDFVTITVALGDSPLASADFVDDALRAHVASGEPAVAPQDESEEAAEASEIEQRIMECIDLKVRPAVAMDGGDIVFSGLENGVVKLELRGACSGCPSSTVTLKMGIESLLVEEFPGDVVAVEAV